MALVSTPESQFADVPNYPYDPQYVDVGGPEMAYVDHGTGEETFLCLHGEPTWGFLYRKMIPTLSSRGRVVVPDFVGFGRSDKYDDPDEYSFGMHIDSLLSFLEALDLQDVTLVCQDWGGILGLSAVGQEPDRFSRIVAMNTGIPDGTQHMADTWHEFREMVETVDELDVGELVDGGCLADLSTDVRAAYDAPFQSEAVKAGARTWPGLIPLSPDDEGAEVASTARERLREWDKPAFVLFGDSDPITGGGRDGLREMIRTASDQPDVWVEDAAHFLQEDGGESVAEHVVEFVDRTERGD